MPTVCLTAPIVWNRAALNAGEVVSLPAEIAELVVARGQGRYHEPHTAALTTPPADKVVRRSNTKAVTGR